MFPPFQKAAWNTFDGKPYGVSFAWGPNVLVYNTEDVVPAPTSWDILFDTKYAGKVTIPDNLMTIADVALWLGMEDPYNLSDDDLRRISQFIPIWRSRNRPCMASHLHPAKRSQLSHRFC